MRKKNQIRVAYALLFICASGVIVRDSQERASLGYLDRLAERAAKTVSANPLPMTTLAESPFQKARPDFGTSSGRKLTSVGARNQPLTPQAAIR